MSRPPRPRPDAPDEPIARAVRGLLWARAQRREPQRPTATRATLSFLTSTATTAAEWPLASSHHVELIGWDRKARRLYAVEHGGERPILQVIPAEGERAGQALPLSADPSRIERLRRDLHPLERAETRTWDLTTRVLQRRGLRMAGSTTPVRKYVLAVAATRRLGGVTIAAGRTTVTAYLRPRIAIDTVWTVPHQPLSVTVISFCGVPAGVGVAKQAIILAVPTLH